MWVSGPQVPWPTGPVSRAVALALATWLGRGGSRKWGETDGEEGAEHELDTGVFGGVWRREDVLAIGGWDERWPINQDSEMAARYLAAGRRLVCIPRWPRVTRLATRCGDWHASTSDMAYIVPRLFAITPTACAALT